MVSIVMPAFNAATFIERTINSVINQEFIDWELIVINDGSSDDTGIIVEGLSKIDSRIRLIQQSNNRQAAARNVGIQNAKYEWIAFIDADDPWVPNKLSIQVDRVLSLKMQNVFLFGDYYSVKDNKESIVHLTHNGSIQRGENLVLDLAKFNFVIPSTVIVHRESLLAVGGFDTSIKYHNVEDFHLWLKLCAIDLYFIHIPRPLCYRYVRDDSSSSTDRGQFFGVMRCLVDLLPDFSDAVRERLLVIMKSRVAAKKLFTRNVRLKRIWLLLILKLRFNSFRF